MPITDLLDRVSFSLGEPTAEPLAPRVPTPDRTLTLELPSDRRGDGSPFPDLHPPVVRAPYRPSLTGDPAPAPEAGTPDVGDAEGGAPSDRRARPAGPGRPLAAPRPPLPSWGIAVIGALALLSVALTAALALALSEPVAVQSEPPSADPQVAAPSPRTAAASLPTPSPASFPAEPAPIPVDLLTRLEEASNEPLDVELSRLLDAIQHGFGDRSVQLEPTLRSYVYRMGSRFEWNPDSFRVAVTAPDLALAAARAAVLGRLFEDAVADGRLDVGTGVGPHALTLVSD